MPQYLLKFLKKEYLKDLLKTGLYMNAAGFFAAKGYEKEDNQNDVYEGLASFPYITIPQKEKTVQERLSEATTEFDKFCATAPIISYNEYKGRRHPIWCCTGIEKGDVKDGIFRMDKRVLDDFFKGNPQDGVAVLIQFDSFIDLVKSHPDEYQLVYGYVDYNDIHKVKGDLTNTGVWWDSIFNKRSDLAYQKEFRIAICRMCEENLEDAVIDHLKTQVLNKNKPYQEYEYALPNVKSTVVRVYEINKLKVDDQYIYFNIHF